MQGVAALASAPLLHAELGRGKKKFRFGFIQNIINKEINADWKSALTRAAGMGFTEMEVGTPMGNSVSDFISFCKEISLIPVGSGIKMTDNLDELEKKLDDVNALEATYVIAYWPWHVAAPFKLQDCQKSAEALNKIGEACRKRGLTLCWHNHDKEFREMEEGLPFDYLMANTDASVVKCEMDVFWVKKANVEPLALMQKYAGRFHALHIKDMASNPEKTVECPGKGVIDFKPIMQEALKQQIQHFIVERDKAEDGMACLQTSSEYLKTLKV